MSTLFLSPHRFVLSCYGHFAQKFAKISVKRSCSVGCLVKIITRELFEHIDKLNDMGFELFTSHMSSDVSS